MSPEELSFARWKIRREIIGMWWPTKSDWKFFKGYSYVWAFGLRHVVWVNERILELLFGIEGRYKLQMRQFLQLNDFGIEVRGLERKDNYHPVYGTSEDPFRDTRRSLLKKRLRFDWRELLAMPHATPPTNERRPEPETVPAVPASLLPKDQLVDQSEAGNTLVSIASPRMQ